MPTLAALVTGPGTAPTVRPSSEAHRVTISDPERLAASTMTVVDASAASSRARAMNRCLVGAAPGRRLADEKASIGHAVE